MILKAEQVCVLPVFRQSSVSSCSLLLSSYSFQFNSRFSILLLIAGQNMLLNIQYIRLHPKLRRRTRVFFGEPSQRNQARDAFQEKVDQEFGRRVHADSPDSLFGTVGILGAGHDLQKASVVAMLEPLYDPKLSWQCKSELRTKPEWTIAYPSHPTKRTFSSP